MCIGIAVGVVVYQPDYPRFLNCIETIIQQAGKVYVFDNGCDKTIQQEDFPEKVVYLSEGRNCGIPYALNRIMELASRDGYEWVVTMDQDSLLPEGLIEAYSEVADRYKEKGIGIICPCVVDKKRGYVTERHTSEKEEYISECITSAACTSIQAWEKVGKYDENMFCAEDYDYWTRIAMCGQIDYINENIYQYRSNPYSLTATQQPRIQAKTSAIHNKYKNDWIRKLNLGWWGKQKLSYLVCDKSVLNPVQILCDTTIQFLNILLFWNPKLRRMLKQRIKSL